MSSAGDIIKTIVPVAAAIAVIAFAPEAWAAWQVAGAAALASTASSLAVGAAFPTVKPDTSFDFDYGDWGGQDRSQVVRQPITYRRIIYGRSRVGGVYTFLESTKDAIAPAGGQEEGNKFLHMLVTVSGHPIDGFEDLYMDDQLVDIATVTGVATGTPLVDGANQEGYTLNTKGWTPSVTGILKAGDNIEIEGLTYEIQADANSDASGLAVLSVEPALKKTDTYKYVATSTIDPDTGRYISGLPQRVLTYVYHANNAAISFVENRPTSGDYAGYLEVFYGDGTTAGDAALNAALNESCPDTWTDEHKQEGCAKVYLRLQWNADTYPSGIPAPSFVVRGKKIHDPRTAVTGWSANAALCVRDYVTSELGLNADSGSCPTTEWSAEANICDEDVTLADGGTEKRYECHGTIDLDVTPKKTIQSLLSSCAGRLVRSNGEWLLYTGTYRTPTVSLGLDDLDGPIKVSSRVSRRDIFNGVKGTFVDPNQSWQATDFPAVQVNSFVAEDQGEELWKDVVMAYTTSSPMAQRLARIELERARRQITVNLQCKLSAYQAMTAETVSLTIPRYGWDNKVFEVMSWSFSPRGDGEAPRLGIDLSLRETDSGVFSWTSAQEQATNVAAATNLPNPRNVVAPTNLTVTENLYATRDGSGVKARAVLAWEGSEDGFAVKYEAEYQPAILGDAEWQSIGETDQLQIPVDDVSPGLQAFRVRARNSIGASSMWVSIDKDIVGLSAPPLSMTGLSLQIIGDQAHLSWRLSDDLDVRIGGKIRVRHSNLTTGATWGNAQDIGPAIPGIATSVILPALQGTYMVKAVDSLGIESEDAISAVTTAATMINFNAVEELDEHTGGWAGIKDDVYVAPDSTLQLAGSDTIDDWPDIDSVLDWDIGAEGISARGLYYFDESVDLGAVVTSRVTAQMAFTTYDLYDLIDSRTDLMDSWTSFDGGGNFADSGVRLFVRTTDDDPSGSPTWSDWTQFVVGDYTTRAFEFRAQLYRGDASHQVSLSELTVTVDMPDKIQAEKDLNIDAAGTAVVFPAEFKVTPTIGVTVSDMATGDRLVLSGETATGFTWRVLDSGGSGVARTGNYIAKGY